MDRIDEDTEGGEPGEGYNEINWWVLDIFIAVKGDARLTRPRKEAGRERYQPYQAQQDR